MRVNHLFRWVAGALLLCIGLSTNSFGQSNGDYRSYADGNWNASNVWQTYSGGSWSNTATAPSSTTHVTISDGTTITLNTTTTIGSLNVGEGTSGTLQFQNSSSTVTFTVNGDVNVAAGGTLSTYSVPTINGNHTFKVTNGNIVNDGTIDFYNTNGSYYSRATLQVTGSSTYSLSGSGSNTLYAFTESYTSGVGFVLYADMTLNGAFTVSSSCTFDMNGHSVSTNYSGTAVSIASNATFSGGNGATITMNGSSVQYFSGAVTIDNLVIDNSAGVNMSSNITVGNQLTLTNGVFKIQSYTLTLNNDLSIGSGSLYGGTSATLVVGENSPGAASTLTIPTITTGLKSLTVNRLNGVTLGDALALSTTGTLTLTSGTLNTTSSNIITIKSTSTTTAVVVTTPGGSSYVNGPMARNHTFSSGVLYTFPVGQSSYNELDVKFSASVSSNTVIITPNDATTGGTAGSGMGSTLSSRYWALTATTSISANATISIYDADNVYGGSQIGASSTLTGTYNSIGGSISGYTVTSTTNGLTSVGTAQYLALNVAPTISGTYSLPGTVEGNTVNNLTQLASVLNSGNYVVSGNVVFEFSSAYDGNTETFPVVFNQFPGSGNAIIRPDAAVSSALITSGTPSGNPLIKLNGTNNLTFDGRSGGSGTSQNWLFRNASLGGNQPTFQFTGASHDTLRYLQIEGQNTSGSSATIYLNTGTTGDSYNSIENNNITSYASGSYTAVNAIYSYGTTANPNSYNSIVNNEISNFTPLITTAATGITVYGTSTNTNYGDNWTISGNSFYMNTTEQNIYQYIPIYFRPGTGSANNTITGNYIGGSGAQCSGTWTTNAHGASGSNYTFEGIWVYAGATTISNNTIKNINLTYSSGGVSFAGIYVYTGSTGDMVIDGNTIGDTGNNTSIQNAGQWGMVGIWNQSNGNSTISNNTIAGMTETNAVNGAAKTIGIYTDNGGNTITNNTIQDLTGACGTSTSGSISTDAAVAGIVQHSTYSGKVQTVSHNIVHNIASSYSSNNATRVYGISLEGILTASVTHYAEGNMVYNISGNDGNAYLSVAGIKLKTGIYQITNNAVRLGYNEDGTSLTKAIAVTGITDSSSGSSTMVPLFYHNSVYIGGTGVTSGSSYAFRRVESNSSPSNLDNIQNNVFVNNRANSSGSGTHYGILLDRTTSVTCDYNLVYGTGSGYSFGGVNTTSYSSLSAWNSASSFDANGLEADPQLAAPDDVTPNLHIVNTPSISPIDQAGNAAATVTYDYDGFLRASYSPVDLGAFLDCSSTVTPSVTASASPGTAVCSGSVTFTASPTNGGTPSYQWVKNGVNVGTDSDTYTDNSVADQDSIWVVMTSSEACASPTTATSSHIVMSVGSQPTHGTLTATPATTDVCEGSDVSATLASGSGGVGTVTDVVEVSYDGGAWSSYTSGSTISTTGYTTIEIRTYRTATGSNCNNSDTTSVSWTIHALPGAVGISPSAPTISSGGSVSLTASSSGASTYTWSPSTDLSASTGATVTASPTATITYTVTAEDSYGCSVSGTVTVTVSGGGCTVNTWTGASGSGGVGYWDIAGNWSCGHVPTASDSVEIPDVTIAPNQPYIRDSSTYSNAVCKSLRINQNAHLTPMSSSRLKINY